MLYAYICYWRWLYIGRGFIVLEHSTHLVWTRRSSHDAADVIVLWITYSVNIDRQAGPCTCIQTLLTVSIYRCVGGCSPYLPQELLGVLIIAPGLSVLRAGRGAGVGGWVGVGVGGDGVVEVFFSLLNFFFQKCSWASETHAQFFFRGGGGFWGVWGAPPGGRAESENDTLLPMTMTCDQLKFWSGPAWRSNVIIRKPWRRKKKNKKKKKRKKKKKNSDKTIRHSRREAGNA